MIGYSRSIKHGLGRRDITYAQIMAWYNYYPDCAFNAIKQLVKESKFGYWGDIKHLCVFVDKNWNKFNLVYEGEPILYSKNNTDFESTHPLIYYATN